MKNKRISNPSAKEFGEKPHTEEKEYRSIKRGYKDLRDLKKISEVKQNSDNLSTDMGTCWMCWMDLTGNGLNDWRREPYSQNTWHRKICPLCGYPHWKGRIWYPFRFNRNYIGNPTHRFGMKDE